MKTFQLIHKLAMAAIIALSAAVMTPGTAHADSTCSSLIPGKFAYVQSHGGWYAVEITVTKDSLATVTYSSGSVWLSGAYLYGNANLLFSDRFGAGSQPFNVNASEQIQIWISQTGQIWLYNNNYRYYIVSGTDFSCQGGLITKYVPGLGVVTIAIRSWYPTIG